MTQQREQLTKAQHSAQFLADDIQGAFDTACQGNPLLAHAMLPLIEDAAKIRAQLGALVEAWEAQAK